MLIVNKAHLTLFSEINAEDEDEEDDDLEEEEFDTKAVSDNLITKSKKRPLSTSESVAKKMKVH